jgi:hypothetical protein
MKKIIKLSLAAALAATAMNAAVVDNVKMSGNAKLFYETNDKADNNLFDQSASKGNVLLTVAASANVGPVKANVRHQTLTSAGLEYVVVDGVQSAGTSNTNYTDIANLSTTIGGTTIIAGKQELATPMCFTEKWNVTPNTFDANVVVNKGLIPNTTIIFADVKTTNAKGTDVLSTYAGETSKFDRVVDATLVAASTTIAGLPVNAYFYDVNNVALGTTAAALSTTWLDTSFKVAGANVKAIYATQDLNDGSDEGTAAAISVATKVAGLNVFAAYSTVNEDAASFCNVATQKKTALPTQAVYVDGTVVAQADADAYKIKVSGMNIAGVKLAVQYVSASVGNVDSTETDLIATTKVGPVAVKALLMDIDKNQDQANAMDQTNLRIVANYSF